MRSAALRAARTALAAVLGVVAPFGATLAGTPAGADPAPEGVVVAVVGSVDRDNANLAGRVLDGTNVLAAARGETVAGWEHPTDHATAVAGLVVAGAPGVRILPVSVTDVDGRTGSVGDLATAIRWAAEHGADIVEVSSIVDVDDPGLRSAVDEAWERGVLVVAGAGNTGSDDRACAQRVQEEGEANRAKFPAAIERVVAVGGLGRDGRVWVCSQRGAWVDVYAPAEDVAVHVTGNRPRQLTGTSFSAPVIAAAAARIEARARVGTPEQVSAALAALADCAPVESGVRTADVSRVDEVADAIAAGRSPALVCDAQAGSSAVGTTSAVGAGDQVEAAAPAAPRPSVGDAPAPALLAALFGGIIAMIVAAGTRWARRGSGRG